MARLLAELEARHPGARELSLLASVRLSLDRLPAKERRQARALAVFHGAAHFGVLAQVLEVEPDEALELCRQLVALGLAGAEGPYLFPDPALGPAVANESSEEERRGMEDRWLAAMLDFSLYLYKMLFQDTNVAAEGTRASLKDLLASLAKAEEEVEAGRLPAEEVMETVTILRELVSGLGRAAVLARVEQARQRLERHFGEWSHARFNSAHAEIEQRWHVGDVNGAVESAERLKGASRGGRGRLSRRRLRPGRGEPDAQPCSPVGRPRRGGAPPLEAAEGGFSALARAGDEDATVVLAVVAADRGDALLDLGRYDEAIGVRAGH